MDWNLICGDARKSLSVLEDNSIHAIVTDPPYGLSEEPNIREVLCNWKNGLDYDTDGNGFMGMSWDSFVPGPSVWRECYRVLKPGGFLIAFGGTRTYDLLALSIRLADFVISNMIGWVYGQGFPKGIDLYKQLLSKRPEEADKWKGWKYGKQAIKPALEPILIAQKPYDKKPVDSILKYEVGACNIEECRTDNISVGQEGRFPANFVLVHSFDCIKSDSGMICSDNCPVKNASSMNEKTISRKHDGDNKKLDTRNMGWGFKRLPGGYEDSGGVDRYFNQFDYELEKMEPDFPIFYCPKASSSEKDAGLDNFPTKMMGMSGGAQSHGEGYDKCQDIGLNRVISRKNIHPTVKPIKLCRWLVRLVSRKGQTVLDPFCGSGSIGCASIIEGRKFVGIDNNEEYINIAEARIAYYRRLKHASLFE